MASVQLAEVVKAFSPKPRQAPRRRFPWLGPRPAPQLDPDRAPEVPALAGVTLEIADGETLSILGPSGCGKTTLLRVIAGLEAPTSGVVSFDQRPVTDLGPAERQIGMVFQNYALYPHLDSYDNLGFSFRLRGRSAEIDERVQFVANTLGVRFEHLLGRKPGQLSGGEQQRVAVGRCIVRDPSVFLFDEPLSNLDLQLRAQTRVEIKRLLRKFGVTAVYVTHDQLEAMALGDRIAIMRAGRIEQVGTAEAIMLAPINRFVAGFFGRPPMNLLDGSVAGPGVQIGAWQLPVPAQRIHTLGAHQGEAITVGLRADAITLVAADDPQRVATGSVVLTEPHFDARQQFVTLDVAGAEVIVRESLGVPRNRGEQVGIRYDPAHILLYDAAGDRLV